MRRFLLHIVVLALIAAPAGVCAAKKKAAAAPKAQAAAPARTTAEFEKLKVCAANLMGREKKTAARAAWDHCIAGFERYQQRYPKSEKAPAALYNAARLRQELYAVSDDETELVASLKSYNRIVREYPKSSLADDALYRIGCLRRDALGQMDKARQAFAFIVETYPEGDMAARARDDLAAMGPMESAEPAAAGKAGKKAKAEVKVEEEAPPVPGKTEKGKTAPAAGASEKNASSKSMADAFGRATLTAIDVQAGKSVTSVSLRLDRPADYSVEFTESGGRTRSPPQLELILLHTLPTAEVEQAQPFESAHLAGFHLKKRFLGSGVRLGFTLTPGTDYDVNRDGSTIVVRFGEKGALKKDAAGRRKPGKPLKSGKGASLSGMRIVIDPGHGGADTGAIGPKGTLEKDVTLAISKKAAAELEGEFGARVWLTRTDDRTLTLDQRDAVAVAKKADLFISIHANAASDPSLSGVETYYLDNATDEAAERLARRENKASGKKLSTVEHILSTMLQNSDTEESRELARRVQGALSKRLAAAVSKGKVRDRGVRSALFYVLVGAKCPAILVESSFLSNPGEEKLLRNSRYQGEVATSIVQGVVRFAANREQQYASSL